MAKKITRDVLESYLNCKYKAHLKLLGQQGAKSEYETLLTKMRTDVKLAATEKILTRHSDAEVLRNVSLTTSTLKQGAAYILDATLDDDPFSVVFDGLKKVDGPSKMGDFHYIPILFHGERLVRTEQKATLALLGLLLSRVQGLMPPHGLIWHGRDCEATRVRLNADLRKTERQLRDFKEVANADSPPLLILNDHCHICEFRQSCHALAVKEDNISLIRGIGEKEVARQRMKGIFTVTQFSYTFRTKRQKEHVAHSLLKNNYALKALAIRENTIFVAQKPEMRLAPTLVYLDVEGIPDRESYYLIGLRITGGNVTNDHSFWADSEKDEEEIWHSFLKKVSELGPFLLFHYGSYETHFLKAMNTRYGCDATLLERIVSSTVNVLSLIYARIYFPTYSNDLKSIASWLGFRWSTTGASGIQSIVWRTKWEADHVQYQKTKLSIYNSEDCIALQKVVDSLYTLMNEGAEVGDSSQRAVATVNDIPEQSNRKLGNKQFALPALAQITKCAYFDYQRDKVLFRTSPMLSRFRRQRQSKKKQKPRANTQIAYRAPRKCPECEESSITTCGICKKLVVDLKVTRSGIKRWVICHTTRRYRCFDCQNEFLPKRYLAITSKYGEVLRKWVAYSSIALRQTNDNVVDNLSDVFGISIGSSTVSEFRHGVAQHYKKTYDSLLRSLVKGQLIHADETKVCIKGSGTGGYVWVFASLMGVVYVYSPTREGNVIIDSLKGFNGVLVSDFYTAYDALDCKQQKCLIHLARDFNDDLLKNPFDEELRIVASSFTTLLQQIVMTIDRFGLRKIHLNKHKKDVGKFYDRLFAATFKSEFAQHYQRRIEKYKDKLFVFLDFDGVPWNNNVAENAVKLIASRRKILGTAFTEGGIRDYLILLSIYQTLRYRQTSFWTFLLSGKANIEEFFGESR